MPLLGFCVLYRDHDLFQLFRGAAFVHEVAVGEIGFYHAVFGITAFLGLGIEPDQF